MPESGPEGRPARPKGPALAPEGRPPAGGAALRAAVMAGAMAAALAAPALCSPAALGADGPLRIGLMAPGPGRWARETLDVVTDLAEELNAAGGVGGRRVEMAAADCGGDPKAAAQAARRLAAEGVPAVISACGSSAVAASQRVFEEAGVAQVATVATADYLSGRGLRLFFRACPRDADLGGFLADSVNGLGFSRAALIHDNTSYAKALAGEARAVLRRSGPPAVFHGGIAPGGRGLAASLARIRASAPDVIVFTGYYPEAALILKMKSEMGWDAPVIGAEAADNVSLLIHAAGASEATGYRFATLTRPEDVGGEMGRRFLEAYSSRRGAFPYSSWPLLAGDAFVAIAEGIRAGGASGPAIADRLRSGLRGREGITGPLAFDRKGDRVGVAYSLYRIDSDGMYYLDSDDRFRLGPEDWFGPGPDAGFLIQ